MMTQSVPTRTSGTLLGATASSYNEKRSRGNDFDMFLAGSTNRETKISVKAKSINGNTENINSLNKNSPTNGKDVITSTIQDKKAMNYDVSSTDNQTVDSVTKQEQKPEDFINADLLGQIVTMLEQIRNLIMEELDLTPEELDSMMKDLGLELSELTDPQAIISLLLADSGNTDPFAMLMDEQLGSKLQGLLSKLGDIKNAANLKLTDSEIRQIFEQSMVDEKGKALLGEDEVQAMQPQLASKKAEVETDKVDKTDQSSKADKADNKYQTISNDDSQTDNPRSVIASSSQDRQLSDSKDQRAKADEVDGLEAFIDRLSANYDKPIADFNNINVRPNDIREIAQQIIEQIRVNINPEQTTLELQLNPEHLGKLNLTISSKEGVMTAHFAVQNDLAKEAIESQLITLKDTLDQQGIKVDSIEVTVASYTFDQRSTSDEATQQRMHKKQRTGHRITFEEAVAMSEESIEEADTINLTGTMGYSVDYTA